MTAAAQRHIISNPKRLQDLHNSNYGIEPEKPESKQYIFTEKKSGKFSKTNYNLIEKNPLAKSILSFVLAMAYKEGDDFLFVLASYASRCGKSAPTVRKAIKYLIDLGHCIMIRHVGRPTEFYFSKYPFTTEEKNFIKSQYERNFLRDGCRSDSDSEEENGDISETAPCVKNFSTATFLVNLFLLYINNNSDNNINSAKPVPSPVVVVDENQNISEEKKQEECYAETITPSPTNTPACKEKNKVRAAVGPGSSPPVDLQKIKSAIAKIQPEHREKIDKSLIEKHHAEYSAEQLADRCIHAIKKSKNPNDPNGYLRTFLENPKWFVAPQDYFKEPERDNDPPPPLIRKKFDIDAHHERLKKIADKNRGVDTKQAECNKSSSTPPEMITKDDIEKSGLSQRLRKNTGPKINPKYQGRKKYYDRMGRPELRSV